MGTFYTSCRIDNHTDRARAVRIPRLFVDTGCEYTWIPAAILQRIGVIREKKDLRFVMANGQIITRSVGFAIIRIGGDFTIDEVVFAEPGDLALLGARTREGLNLTVGDGNDRKACQRGETVRYPRPTIPKAEGLEAATRSPQI